MRKHVLLWNKHEYQHSADIFVKITLTHFMVLVFFCTSRNHQKTRGFLIEQMSNVKCHGPASPARLMNVAAMGG